MQFPSVIVNNVLVSIYIDMMIVQFYTRPSGWENFFEAIQDRRGFPMLETCVIHLVASAPPTPIYQHILPQQSG